MIHSSSDTKNDLEYHLDILSNDNTVFDRCNLGEIVYPAIYGRTPKMTIEEQEYVIEIIKNLFREI